jgi:dTMP kinase
VSGAFVAFEGGEGTGKSTQAALLAGSLGAVLTFEPGATAVGARVRELVLDPSVVGVAARAEALLMAADRAQHVREVVRPALAAGQDVVTDRHLGSFLAYQGYGRGLDVEELRWLSRWASEGLEPDVVVLLDVPRDVVRARLGRPADDRMEAEDEEFHARVAAGFRTLAAEDPERWVVIDGPGSVEAVAAEVWARVGKVLGR